MRAEYLVWGFHFVTLVSTASDLQAVVDVLYQEVLLKPQTPLSAHMLDQPHTG